MLSLFQSHPLIDQTSANWIFDSFDWALKCFDSREFFYRSRLVQPTNEFFPGSVNSVHAKAENIFQHTLRHSGLSHWPFQLQPPEQSQEMPVEQLLIDRIERNSSENSAPALPDDHPLWVTYHPQQTLKPEDLASNYAHQMAQHLVMQTNSVPPGGVDYFLEGTEVLAIFMGFGVMLVNSAYTFRGGCGGCHNGQANRQATLSENEVIFALALFCYLKEIPTAEATRFLKKHLRGSYRQALKQITSQPERLDSFVALR